MKMKINKSTTNAYDYWKTITSSTIHVVEEFHNIS